MPTVIPPGYAEIAIQLRHAGDPQSWYNVSGYDVSAFGGDMVEMGTSALLAFSAWIDHFPTTLTVVGADVTLGQDGGPPSKQFVGNTQGATGGKSQAMLPQNCALLVQKNTALGGRRNRGRAFIPSVLQDDWVDNVGAITPAARNELQTVADQWWEFMNESEPPFNNIPMVILHGSEGAPIQAAEDPTPVTGFSVDPVISTQRRRLR